MRRTLIVMVKEPQPGRVKTRLGKDIGLVDAAWWFRWQVSGLLRRLEDPRWTCLLAVSPDVSGMQSRVWPAQFQRTPQGRGSLGDRMARLLHAAPLGPVCLVGSDIPGIQRTHVARAFQRLGDHDAVFGPAPDGGFWLVGVKRTRAMSPGLFSNVRWSTHHALADTMASFADYRIALIDHLRDVDTVADLRMTSQTGRDS